MQKHAKHVKIILKCLQVFKLFVKFSKCCFSVTDILYFKYHVSLNNIAMKSDHVIIINK